MTATYDSIATTTLGSAAANITFSSISSSFTDLKLVIVGTIASGTDSIRMLLNLDTATNYSVTRLLGDGASATSTRFTGVDNAIISTGNFNATTPSLIELDLFGYAGSTNKTYLSAMSADNNGSGAVARFVGLWRNTSAVNSIRIFPGVTNWAAGTTATLYGIKAE